MNKLLKRLRRRLVGELRRRWTTALYSSGLPAVADRSVARRVLASVGEPSCAGAHLVASPPGDGNIGDQALFEAFVEGLDGPVIALVRAADEIAVPDSLRDRVTLAEMPDLIYGRRAAHAQAVADFTRRLAGARSLSIIGADIMDGK